MPVRKEKTKEGCTNSKYGQVLVDRRSHVGDYLYVDEAAHFGDSGSAPTLTMSLTPPPPF